MALIQSRLLRFTPIQYTVRYGLHRRGKESKSRAWQFSQDTGTMTGTSAIPYSRRKESIDVL